MNGFTGGEENQGIMSIVQLMLQSLFPPIKVHEMNLSSCKRVVMFNKSENETDEIEFRHYGVSARQRALNRGIKKLVNKNRAPNLSGFNSLADYVLKG